VAHVGLGSWAGVIANAEKRSKKVRIVTCYTRTPEEAGRSSARSMDAIRKKSFEDVLKRDDVEGIILTTPNAIHAEQAVLAAQHGKHVYVDKPIANTLADGKKMIEACQEGRRGLAGRPRYEAFIRIPKGERVD